MTEWINETLYSGWGQRFEVVNVLAREKSAYQEILVVQTRSHGRALLLDGNVQITEADEFIYQEMVAHVPIFAHGAAKHVLIIGAGDGGVLKRVLEHPIVERATMVEIDRRVINLARAFLPMIGGSAWDDKRATIVVGDGVEYVASSSANSYDVIIVDSTDPAGVGGRLFTHEFYGDCARILRTGGLIVNQCGVPFMQAEELAETSLIRAKFFPFVSAYIAAVPTYVGGLMAFGFASSVSGFDTVQVETLRARASAAQILGTTQYWSPEVHVAAFQLPPYIGKQLPHSA